MLEYFSYKKYKKAQEERQSQGRVSRKASREERQDGQGETGEPSSSTTLQRSRTEAGPPTTILRPEDQDFFEDLCSDHGDDDGSASASPPPPLPPRIYAWDMDSCSETEPEGASGTEGEGVSGTESPRPRPPPKSEPPMPMEVTKTPSRTKSVKEEKKPSRLSVLFTRPRTQGDTLKPSDNTNSKNKDSVSEAEREEKDASRVLSRLNFFVKNNTVLSYSTEASDLLQRFTLVFKDLASGVPTAYDDLTKLIEDRDGSIARMFDKLPAWMQRLVTQLPERVTASLGPELLTAAAASQGLKVAAGAGAKETAKGFLRPSNLADLVRKPGAVVGMFKAIVGILKTRWPAFIGMNVIWSVALSLLLVVLWYCYKRGREERLDREQTGTDSPRFEELPNEADHDVPAIVTSSEPEPSTSEPQRRVTSRRSR